MPERLQPELICKPVVRHHPGTRSGVLTALLVGLMLSAVVGVNLTVAAELSFDLQDGSFDCGEIYRVELHIDASVTDLRGYSLVLEYDPSILTPWAVSAGSLMTSAACDHFFMWLNPVAAGDSLVIDGATLGCSMTGPGDILVLEFEGEVQGISPLDCLRGRLRTGTNAPIPFTCLPGTVDYRCPVPDQRIPWGSVKAAYHRR